MIYVYSFTSFIINYLTDKSQIQEFLK